MPHYSRCMSNLMPEVHVNKNGVPVKKYVRVDPKSGSGATGNLPMPSMGSAVPRVAAPLLGMEIANASAAEGFTLDDLDSEAVGEIESLLKGDEDQRPKLYGTLSAVKHALNTLNGEARVVFLHNVAAFGAVLQGKANNSFVSYINGLSAYPDTVLYPDMDYLLDAPEKTMERAQHLLDFTTKAYERSKDRLVYDAFIETWATSTPGESDLYTNLRDPKLAMYVMDHPEQSEQIMELLHGKEDIPFELMVDRLNFSVQSMSEGLL